jgi:hypothetical protein
LNSLDIVEPKRERRATNRTSEVTSKKVNAVHDRNVRVEADLFSDNKNVAQAELMEQSPAEQIYPTTTVKYLGIALPQINPLLSPHYALAFSIFPSNQKETQIE